MSPDRLSARLRALADRVSSGRPSLAAARAEVRIFLASASGTFSGMKLVKADIVEWEPDTLADTGFVTISGSFEFISPTGKKVEVNGSSGPNGMDLDVVVDGVPFELEDGEEEFLLGRIDPDGYSEEDLDWADSIDGVLADVCRAEAG